MSYIFASLVKLFLLLATLLLASNSVWRGHISCKVTMRAIVPVMLLCCFVMKGKNKYIWVLKTTNVLFHYCY